MGKTKNPFGAMTKKLGAGFKKLGKAMKKPFQKMAQAFKMIGQAFKCIAMIFQSIGSHISCGIQKLINLPKCLLYYLLDTLFFIFIELPIWILWLILTFINKELGKLYKKMIKYIGKMILKVDDIFYSYTSLHIFRYQDSVIQRCYKCKNFKPFPSIKKITDCGKKAKKGIKKSCDAVSEMSAV